MPAASDQTDPGDARPESQPGLSDPSHPERRSNERRSYDRRSSDREEDESRGAEAGPSLDPSVRDLGEAALGTDFDPMEREALTRPEYIAAMVHFYRGEMYRSQVWRTRLDTTTNWAVVTVAGMISFAFSQPAMPADLVLLANVLIGVFLGIEARRYRYFAVFRARVRMIEENFYLPMLRRDLHSPRQHWRESVARDLDQPKFKTTMLEATMFRLRRNYVWLFFVILITWVAKLFAHPQPAQSLAEVYSRAGFGILPAWIVFLVVVGFYGFVLIKLLSNSGKAAAADEIQGLEHSMDSWKF